MSQIDDIIAEKQAALKIIDAEISYCLRLKNDATPEEQAKIEAQCIQPLLNLQDEILLQECERISNSDEMAAALDQLKAATHLMESVAQRMTTVTATLTKISDFVEGGQKVITALKKQ